MVCIGIRPALVPAIIAATLVVAGCSATGEPAPPTSPNGTAGTDTALSSFTVPDPIPSTPSNAFNAIVVPLAPGTSDEASGIAAASGPMGGYFLVDDAGGTDSVVAVGPDGAVLDRIPVDAMSADNAEALASGTCGANPLPDGSKPQTCLYVGDIGDNRARRDEIAIFRFGEPDLSVPPADPVPADEWRYSYPDGAQNAEAMLVDGDGSVLIVTKPPPQGGLPHRIYRAKPGGGELTFVREFRPPAAERPFRTLLTGNVVTDLAASPGRVLLLTYDEVQEFTAPDPAAVLSSFPDWPHRRLPSPTLAQAEGIAAGADGCGFTVASEAGLGSSHGSLGIVSCG